MSTDLVPIEPRGLVDGARRPGGPLPPCVLAAGQAAQTAWDDFFEGKIANKNTRLAYERAVRYFLLWAEKSGKALHEITAGDVGRYLRELSGAIAKKKQHLAGLRKFFNLLVERHLVIINPAAVAETERLQVVEGKTREISDEHFRALMSIIDTSNVVGKRDVAATYIMAYTGARGGAVAKLDLEHYQLGNNQWELRFEEKGGKSRLIPVSHDLQTCLDDYIDSAELKMAEGWSDPVTGDRRYPLFRTAVRREKRLNTRPMTGLDIYCMFKRHAKRAGLPPNLSPHSLRVAVANDLHRQGVSTDEIQYLLGHADARTTRIYFRGGEEISRNLVERIRLGR